MKYRRFLSIGWQVSELGLGTYPFSTNWGKLVEESEAVEIIRRALELGVNFIDTADVYGYGRAETLLGQFFLSSSKRDKVCLATKGGRDFTSRPGEVFRNFETRYLRRSLEASLERFRTNYVDLYQLHGPEKDVIEEGEIFEFLTQIKKEGLTRAVGVSVNSLDEIYSITKRYPVDAVGLPFNILTPYRIEEVLDLCLEKKAAVILREPLAQGLLTGKYHVESKFEPSDFRSEKFNQERLEKAESVVEGLRSLGGDRITPAQIALRYVLSYESAATVIFGAKSVSQLGENLLASDRSLNLEEINQIEEVRKEFVLS